MAKPDKIDMKQVLDDISMGMSVLKACEKQKVSNKTFYDKLKESEELKNEYARARELRGEKFVESIEEDLRKIENKELDPASGRVIVDTKKWLASKFYPKMYGEKQSVELTGKDGQALNPPIINVLLEDGNGNES